ncbi:hypothetical protein O6H91_12G052100 [Diphasiastrum complanatum]|uniref:Uncharacterized protein n=2 Tax=Diphasiastrum complanatum TaxID=34168 RepID=A0ACC2C1T3_DIPCM|nr:hypothetical protein O6H91_12G052100 [Diphasiastrum complanatum]KAJ7535973.1 hypothetical protein O6H91_12G052100 [Diphasiastrum complanatum]
MASTYMRAAGYHLHVLRLVGGLYSRCQFNTRRHMTKFKAAGLASSGKAVDVGKDEGTGLGLKKAPVIIVGAGPVGLTLAILLTKLGVRTILLEKKLKLTDHPQAHFLNNRTMEIFRRINGLGHEIEDQQPPMEHWRRFVYCTTLAGPILGLVDHLQPEDMAMHRSPTGIAHFSQHHLVRLLLKHAFDLGIVVHEVSRMPPMCSNSQSSNIGEIYMGHELKSLHANSSGVTTRVLSFETKVETVMHGSYLVAADGAGSIVRKIMGVEFEGEADMQKLINVHFRSKALGRHLARTNPGMLYFVFNARAIVVIVAHDLRSGEFVAQLPYYPPQQNFEDFSPEVCQQILFDVAGLENLDLEVKAVKNWVMHAQVAEKFLCGNDRVILIGDAAHRFPPAGGFGMNTGIQDAHNLAWKLSLILKGCACPTLLDTYEEERRPVAVANTKLSVANFKAAMAIPSALGLDPSIARLVHEAFNSKMGLILPTSMQQAFFNGIFALGRGQVTESFLSRYNPIAMARLSRVQSILQEGDSLQLQFPAEDLGFRYTEGALVPESAFRDGLHVEPTGRRREYVPSSMPGARLPHLKLAVLEKNCRQVGKEISTLDLASGDIVEFLMIVGCCSSGCYWAAAALQIGEAYNIPVKVAVIWPAGSMREKAGKASVRPHECMNDTKDSENCKDNRNSYEAWQNLKKTVVHAEEIDVSWWALCGLPSYGALLVRPDDHIAWRSHVEFGPNSLQELKNVFAKILQRRELASSLYTSHILFDKLN